MLFELIVPCYNESLSLAALIARTATAAQAAGLSAEDFQLILVDNGSTDATQMVLEQQRRGEFGRWFRVEGLRPNAGYGGGILRGLEASTARYIGWTHADGQCDPADAFTALAKLQACAAPDNTIVKGTRRRRAWHEYLWSRFFEIMAWVGLGVFLWEINAQPKVFSRRLLLHLKQPPSDIAWDLYVLYRARLAGWRMLTVPVCFAPRAHGVSHWAFSLKSRFATGWKMIRYIFRLRAQSR